MGTFAEVRAGLYNFTHREQRDLTPSPPDPRPGRHQGRLLRVEITPVTVAGRKGQRDHPAAVMSSRPTNLEKIPTLKPAFHAKDGTVTNQLQLHLRRRRSPGADARLHCRRQGLTPITRIVGHSTHARNNPVRPPPPGPGAITIPHQDRLDGLPTWTCGRSTRPSRWSPWPPSMTSAGPRRVSITAAPAPWATIGASARASSPCKPSRRPAASRGIASLCIGGGEATALAVEML